MQPAAAMLVVDGIMTVEDRHGIAMRGLQRPQPLLIVQT